MMEKKSPENVKRKTRLRWVKKLMIIRREGGGVMISNSKAKGSNVPKEINRLTLQI